MQEKLEWVLRAKDLISPAADAGAASLLHLEISLKQTARELTALERVAHSLSIAGALKGVGGSILGAAGSVLGLVGDAAVGFGKLALSGAAFREDTQVAFTQILGSAQKADELFENALAVAKQTKFETRGVVEMYTDLLSGGFKQNELNTLVAGMADVGTARGLAKATELKNALIKMRGEGKTTWDAFAEAGRSSAGIPILEMAKMLKLDVKNTPLGKLGEQVRKAMNDGKVSSEMGITAILERIKNQYDPKGVLGDFAKAQSETLSGVWSNFKESFENLFLSKQTQELPAIKKLKDSMLMLSGFFDTTTPKGQRVLTVVNKIAEDLLSVFDLDPKNAEKTLTKLLGWLEQTEVAIRRLTTWVKNELFPAISNAFNQEGGLGATLTRVALAIGRVVGQGIWEGVTSAGKGAATAVATGAGFAPPSFEPEPPPPDSPAVRAAQASARERQAEEERRRLLGGSGGGPVLALPGGFGDIPKMASGGIVDRPTLAIIGEAGPEAVVPLSGAGAGFGVREMNVTINVLGAQQPAETAQQVRVELARLIGGAARAPSPSRM